MIVLLCGSGVAFVGYRLYDRISAVGREDRELAEANAKSCAGKTYLGQKPDRDRCADASHTAVVDGLKITVTPLARAGAQRCTEVTIVNTGDESEVISTYAFGLQNPSGVVADPGLTRTGRELGTADLVPGGTASGNVCFDVVDPAKSVLVWDSEMQAGQRGVWLVDELTG